MSPRIGTAGWQIPRTSADAFPAEGSTLERYASRFDAVEINSSFYRSHRPGTWTRWAEATPEGFRFAVKLPKRITHEAKLVEFDAALDEFLGQVALLGQKLGPVLVQLPPSLAFDAEIAGRFFESLRGRHPAQLACEPRHPSWWEPDADQLLREHQVARVAADPARVPAAAHPGGWPGLTYWRWHGSPQMYWSAYGAERLAPLAAELKQVASPCWCMFDNTTSGAAAADALLLQDLTRLGAPARAP